MNCGIRVPRISRPSLRLPTGQTVFSYPESLRYILLRSDTNPVWGLCGTQPHLPFWRANCLLLALKCKGTETREEVTVLIECKAGALQHLTPLSGHLPRWQHVHYARMKRNREDSGYGASHKRPNG